MITLPKITKGSVLAVTLLLFLSSFSLLVYSPDSEAKPTIEWSPTSIDLEVKQGSSESIIVNFTSSTDLEDVSFNITPSLSSYIELSPNDFQSLTKDEIYTIEIIVTTPPNSEIGQLDGTIKLKGIKQQRKHNFFRRFWSWCSRFFEWRDNDKDKYENLHSTQSKIFSRPLPVNLVITDLELPKISWAPESLELAVTAGETISKEVMFTTSKNMENIELVVSPELQQHITVAPDEFSQLLKDNAYLITVTGVATSEAIPKDFVGSIYLKHEAQALEQTLPTEVNVVWPKLTSENFDFSLPLPPYINISYSDEFLPTYSITNPKYENVISESPGLYISIYSNEQGLSTEEFFDGEPGLNLFALSENTYELVDIDGIPSYIFHLYLTSGTIIIIPRTNDFVEVFDNGLDLGFEDDVLDHLLESLEVQ